VPQAVEITRNQRYRGMIIIEKGLVTCDHEPAAGVGELKNLGAEVLKSSLNFASVGDQSFAVKQAVGRSQQKNAAAYKQNDGDGKSRPGNTSKREGHRGYLDA
jgi:hypothetical protein